MDVNIYSNPATDLINVRIVSKSDELINYSLSDMTGRIVDNGQWSFNSSNSRFTLNLSNGIKGVSLLKLSSDEGQSTFSLIKK